MKIRIGNALILLILTISAFIFISWTVGLRVTPNELNEVVVFRDVDFRVGDDLIGTIPDQANNRFSVTDLEHHTNFAIRTVSDKSVVLIGNTNNGLSGIAFDASNGDGAGGDYGTLYQYDNGLVELRNLRNSPIVFDIGQDRKIQITPQGDLFVNNVNHGLIMKSPDGNCWKMTVDNNGSLTSIQTNCPAQ